MTDDVAFEWEDLHARIWLDAFPWLQGVVEPWKLSEWMTAIDDADAVVRSRRLAEIAELAMTHLTRWTIGQVFPGLQSDLDPLGLELLGRANNALIRANCTNASQLLGITVGEMMEWRQVAWPGLAILQALANHPAGRLTPNVQAGPRSTSHLSAPPELEAIRLPEWMSSLVDDLTKIATWYSTVGLPGRPFSAAPCRRHAGRDRQGPATDRELSRQRRP